MKFSIDRVSLYHLQDLQGGPNIQARLRLSPH